jgi:hypothetical protein
MHITPKLNLCFNLTPGQEKKAVEFASSGFTLNSVAADWLPAGTDNENHPRPEVRQISVVFFEGIHRGVVGFSDRRERLSSLHFMMHHGLRRSRL